MAPGLLHMAAGEVRPDRAVALQLSEELRPPWLAPDQAVPVWLERNGGELPEGRELAHFREAGRRRAAVVASEAGISFGFDPDETVSGILEERYLTPRRPLHTRLPISYQWVPGELRLRLFRLLATPRAGDDTTGFPEWPVDRSVETLRWVYRHARTIAGDAAAGASPPRRWPDGRRWAFATSHDVDTREGLALAPAVAECEAALGFRGTWFVVGELFDRDPAAALAIAAAGHELALHGDRHDNRIAYLDSAPLERRLDRCQPWIERHDLRGFRAPSLLESRRLRAALAARFSYASQVPDTETAALIAPRRGCSTSFPFEREGLLEIPMTLPMEDKLLLAGLDEEGILGVWRRKLEWARQSGGIAQLAVHNEPHLLKRSRGAWQRLLAEVADDGGAWCGTLGQIADHWQETSAGA